MANVPFLHLTPQLQYFYKIKPKGCHFQTFKPASRTTLSSTQVAKQNYWKNFNSINHSFPMSFHHMIIQINKNKNPMKRLIISINVKILWLERESNNTLKKSSNLTTFSAHCNKRIFALKHNYQQVSLHRDVIINDNLISGLPSSFNFDRPINLITLKIEKI